MTFESDPTPAALEAVALRLFWWKSPSEALVDRRRFTAQVMTLGNWEDVQMTRRELGEGCLREALLRPPPGVFDERSWYYWHAVLEIQPVPPLPQRSLP
jgi:hypothetical protein